MQGRITNVQPFSIQDGPGIRTTVFLKGCNLHCEWCHNPEAMQPQPQIQWFPQKCIGCGACLSECSFARDGRLAFRNGDCIGCGRCAAVCYSEALVLTGKLVTPEILVKELLVDCELFAQSGGGVTFSGGEPYMQAEFLKECLSLLQAEEIHTAVETAACVPWERIERAAPELLICDLKSMDAAALARATGGNLELILQNIRNAAARGKPLWVRVPLIPGFNDTAEQMARMAEFVNSLAVMPFVELLPFHDLCVGKYDSLGLPFPAAGIVPPTREHRRELADVWRQAGIVVKWE